MTSSGYHQNAPIMLKVVWGIIKLHTLTLLLFHKPYLHSQTLVERKINKLPNLIALLLAH